MSASPLARPAQAAAGPRVPAGPLRALLLPLCRAFEALAMLMVVVATGAILLEVLARGLFNLGLPAAGELARYAGLGVIFLTVPLLLARGEHVRVDMLLQLTRGRLRRLLDGVNELATLAFCVLFMVSCWWFMQRAGRFATPALGMPNLAYYAPAIAGMALTTLVALDRVLGLVSGGSAAADPAAEQAPPC